MEKNKKVKSKLTDEERRVFAAVGSMGGKSTLKKYGKEYLRELGRKGAQKRWDNHKKYE